MYRSQNQQELTKFQKNEARILAKLISELWNLSMTLEGFPDAYEIAKIKPVFKKSSKIRSIKLQTKIFTAFII